jgi:Na+/proline symporter
VLYDPLMLMFALDEAATTTIVFVLIWFVVFPALVTGLIGIALFQTYRERAENEAYRSRRRR